MRRWVPILLSTLICATPAFADVTLRYAPDGEGTTALLIQADDHGHVRASVVVDPTSGARPGIDLLMDGDQIYMVDGTGERPALARIEDVLALAAEARTRLQGPARPMPQPVHTRITPHGAERVGQWNGILYWVEPDPPRAGMSRGELVVSNDPALVRYATIAQRVVVLQERLLSAVFGVPDDPASSRAMHDLLGGGLFLRQAQLYHLESISTDPVPAERFAVGDPALTRDQLRARHAADNRPRH